MKSGAEKHKLFYNEPKAGKRRQMIAGQKPP
jgi:hypothetical protein